VHLNGHARRSHVIVPRPEAPAPISDVIRGARVEAVLRTAEFLLIRLEDGREVRIGWHSPADGSRLSGLPMVEEVRRFK
jgi:hypothetical protein